MAERADTGFPRGAITAIGLYIACELVANITAGKPVVVSAWGPVVVPAGVFIYALTFTLLDLINDQLGRVTTRRVVVAAFWANALLAAYAQLTVWLPAPAFFEAQAAFARVLGATPRIVGASLAAYLVSSLVDAEVFAWWRARVGGYRWLRVLASNTLSTGIDSVVFVTLAFAGTLPVGPLILGQYGVKMAVTLVSLPLIYLVRALPVARMPSPPADVYPQAPRPGLGRRGGLGMRGIGGLALAVALAAAVATAAPQAPVPRFDPGQAPALPTAVGRVSPAVVGIRAQIPPDRPSVAALGAERWGSGVIIDADGTILTVGYVVLEASVLEVVLRDGRTVPARVIGHDFESGLAVLRLAADGPYPAAALGRSAPVGPGNPVSSVGVSQDGRLVAVTAAVTAVRPFVAYWEYMLDRAIIVAPPNPAFGGAALVDADGALIGIVSLRVERENLAIPIDLFPPVRGAILAQGRPARPPRPWLGVRAVSMEGGVVIAGVSSTGPAHAAGLRQGDVIVRLNGDRVADLEDFYRKLWRTLVGSEVELNVYRDGQLETVTVRPRDRHAIFRYRTP